MHGGGVWCKSLASAGELSPAASVAPTHEDTAQTTLGEAALERTFLDVQLCVFCARAKWGLYGLCISWWLPFFKCSQAPWMEKCY